MKTNKLRTLCWIRLRRHNIPCWLLTLWIFWRYYLEHCLCSGRGKGWSGGGRALRRQNCYIATSNCGWRIHLAHDQYCRWNCTLLLDLDLAMVAFLLSHNFYSSVQKIGVGEENRPSACKCTYRLHFFNLEYCFDQYLYSVQTLRRLEASSSSCCCLASNSAIIAAFASQAGLCSVQRASWHSREQ